MFKNSNVAGLSIKDLMWMEKEDWKIRIQLL